MGSCALHDRLKPAEPHPDQFPNIGLSIRPFVDHREPLRLVWAQRQNDPSSGFDLIEDRRRQSLGPRGLWIIIRDLWRFLFLSPAFCVTSPTSSLAGLSRILRPSFLARARRRAKKRR